MSLTVLALDPHLGGVAWLREFVCHELGGDLMMADSVPAMETAIDARTPDLLVIGPGTPPGVETDARAILRADRATAGTEVVRLGRPPAESPKGRSGLGRWLGSSRPSDAAEETRIAKRRINVTVERIRAARERRLQEELAARLKASVTAPVGVPAGFTPPVLAGTSAVAPGTAGTRPNGTRFAPLARAAAPEPIGGENEWGFFDPERCGADALADALERAPVDPRGGVVERSPADLLLEFDAPVPKAARAASTSSPETPLGPCECPGSSKADESPLALDSPVDVPPAVVSAASTAVPEPADQFPSVTFAGRPDTSTGARPFPLALWAHLADCCHAAQHPGPLRRWSEGFAGLATLALGLQLASSVGPTAAPVGCRIHRIRIVETAAPSAVSATPWSQVATVGELDR